MVSLATDWWSGVNTLTISQSEAGTALLHQSEALIETVEMYSRGAGAESSKQLK